jgi:amidase
MKFLPLLLLLLLCTCGPAPSTSSKPDDDLSWAPYDQSSEIAENANHESRKMRYRLIQSRVTDRSVMLNAAKGQLGDFAAADYERLKPLIYEQNIPSLQAAVSSGTLSYELITKWFLYRIVKFESGKDTYLNAVISINPNAVAEARQKDVHKGLLPNLIFGLPVLLKDNVNFAGLPTTAGADALRENEAADAYITTRLKANGAIILGKTNLSEWANFLCDGCPNGYSAVGGQTLNAYGRKRFDTGGSSSGSGAAMAANYAVAAVGTETSGSILSPSSQSSLVGLKPTVGLLSRTGIVPISSTLDTPGPMTRSVIDNAILLSAMTGADPDDPAAVMDLPTKTYVESLESTRLAGKRFGVIRRFLDNQLYVRAVEKLVELGADTVAYDPPEVDLSGFLSLLNADMKVDLPAYLKAHAGPKVGIKDVASVIQHNLADTTKRAPYGMARFYGIEDEKVAGASFTELKARLMAEGSRYFSEPMAKHRLDAVLSINNYSAGFAAVAHYPALTVPMGYDEDGKPFGLTFIGRPFLEENLLGLGYAFERGSRSRKAAF